MQVIIQARTNSKRFKNKVMEDINGDTMLMGVYMRCKNVWPNTTVVIPEGDLLKKYLYDNNIPFFEGPEEDVLERYYKCAMSLDARWVCRITSDCPIFHRGSMVDMINLSMRNNYDYITNLPCPDGWDIQIASMRLLELVHKQAKGKDREHVFSWVMDNKAILEKMTMGVVQYREPVDLESSPKYSVDTPEDLERVRKLVEGWK